MLHPISPTYDSRSRILILGSFPSVKSREIGYFYGHPQNRFWKVLAAIFNNECPNTIEEKRNFLLSNKIAVWDVIASCDIEGSSDSSIKNVVANDLSKILESAKITRIFTNGKKADSLYKKFTEEKTGIKATCLPSTSPANAAWSFERLLEAWQVIKEE